MKRALLLAAIDPYIGGVLIFGHRGTAKSTAVRALADLLPSITRVRGCAFGCDPARQDDLCTDCQARISRGVKVQVERVRVPVVDLPLGATEDRVCGTLDIERALVEGAKAFEPGLLARANRGFLYVDEVNLLEDHLVDLLLDSAASGRNVVERESISVSHPARFVLVGSGNPEEGELRPQLLDRFGLFTQIETIEDLDQRVEIVRRRERFEKDPSSFCREWDKATRELRKELISARKVLPRVRLDSKLLLQIAELCVALKVDGHRGELTIVRSSKALAALQGRTLVDIADIQSVATMSLRHRLRRDALDRIESEDRIADAVTRILESPGPSKIRAAL